MIVGRVYGTPIRVKATVLVNIVALWAVVTAIGLSWSPERDFWQGLLVGFAAVLLLLVADFGHAIAHIFSARHAGAPMDEVFISGGMPRTLYWNNEVPPQAHRMRAIGGPIFSTAGLLISISILGMAAEHSLVRELALWSAIGHGFILIGSLLPLPIVDGGSILKWTLVGRGKTTTEADEIVRRVGWVVGIAAGIIGIGLMVTQQWLAGLILLGGGIAIGVAADKLR